MKILYVTTIGRTNRFFESLIRELIAAGHQVDFAANEDNSPVPDCYRELDCPIYQIDFSRSPLSMKNLRSFRQLRKVVKQGGYDAVHCHTPVASLVTRWVCRRYRKKLKVFCTAHGFHFYKGAPLKNWLVYYPFEWLCSFWTDTLITINSEDYERAQRRFHAKRVEYVPGVGMDHDKFASATVDRAQKRRELGIPENAFLLISVGEVNQNKNQSVVIRALAQLHRPDIHYLIVGKGPMEEAVKDLAEELGIGAQVHLPGYRHDIPELLKASDVIVFPSIREGLGLAALEGMAAGLPLICADNRGTREFASAYCREDYTGVCSSPEMYAAAIQRLADDPQLYDELSQIGPHISKNFTTEHVNQIMFSKIYGL